jgi:hypothetical protein
MTVRMPQQRPVGAAAVGLVSQHPRRPGAWPSRAKPRHADAAQHRPKLGAVAALASGEHDRQRPLATLDRQVQLAAQPTPGAAKGMVGRLEVDPARFFALPVPPLSVLGSPVNGHPVDVMDVVLLLVDG